MKQLEFYISNIEPNVLKTIGGRSRELIALIRSGKQLNEKTIASKLFKDKWSHQNYLNLKNRTKKILEVYFLLSPQKNSNENIKKMNECRKAYVLGMQFIERAKRDIAKKLLLKSYHIAVDYGFTKIAYDSAVELMASASLERKAAKFTQYEKIIEQLELDLRAERKAHQYYYKAILQMNAK